MTQRNEWTETGCLESVLTFPGIGKGISQMCCPVLDGTRQMTVRGQLATEVACGVSMEEADLLEKRLQAIRDKRRIQEDIVQKRLQTDKEKLKLQHLKKKSLKEQWLLDGLNTHSSKDRELMVQQAKEESQLIRCLQSHIHRMEKEIEALEREELNISANEGFILKRLNAIEKTPEDIIKAANADFKHEPITVCPVVPDIPDFRLLEQGIRSQSSKDEPKHALFAMEINTEKDLRTGKSTVLSTANVSPQELQQRGVKVYDDGRKSVYALPSDTSRPGLNGVDELTAAEVEELLRQATRKKKKDRPKHHMPVLANNCDSMSAPSKTHQDSTKPRREDLPSHPELMYGDTSHCPMEEIVQPTEQWPWNFGICPAHQQEPHLPLDPCEPITMIFMGYQNMKDDCGQGYEGSIRAELVVIGDDEAKDEGSLGIDQNFHSQKNCNANNICGASKQLKQREVAAVKPSANVGRSALTFHMEK
ncbi:palmdelphin isoform X1 [Denticeps clupeoides]|uniref:palmdelphin isoform X1 n=1 Tax=Denticeps clupeoides TaxID=299321 RepID=UPI0010A31099|nr:palmdelphin-like isoform X1 [Denticeps clupeoides]